MQEVSSIETQWSQSLEVHAQVKRHMVNAVHQLLTDGGAAKGVKAARIGQLKQWFSSVGIAHRVAIASNDELARAFFELVPQQMMIQLEAALNSYVAGDDADLRTYVKPRYCVELGKRIASPNNGALVWRSRKFSSPLFLTPAGFLAAYPEIDEDLFIDTVQVQHALEFYKNHAERYNLKDASYSIYEAKLGCLGGSAYRRWLKEVKEVDYKEPRRSLQETYAIYQEQGVSGLKDMYSRTYVFVLLRKFKAAGLEVTPADEQYQV